MALVLKHTLILLLSSLCLVKFVSPFTHSANFGKKIDDSSEPISQSLNNGGKVDSLGKSRLILRGEATITSANGTFRLGFFAPNDRYSWYLGIWYNSIPIPTYIWVANREKPAMSVSSAHAELTESGRLAVTDQESKTLLWETNNVERATDFRLLEQGNLVLLSADGRIVWQSFDFPSDTSLPGMNFTAGMTLNSWRSSVDPSPGRYFLRLNPPDYGEFALYYSNNGVGVNDPRTYWTTGKWSGSVFASVPEMTIPYIYKFSFVEPFTPMATFTYEAAPLEAGMKPPLTRFFLDHTGRLKQLTWSQQSSGWLTFWSQPENVCSVYGLCGSLGFCNGNPLSPCQCLKGFHPTHNISWTKNDFSSGCSRTGHGPCGERDKFEELRALTHERTMSLSSIATRVECKNTCLKSCSCIGLSYNSKSHSCSTLYGPLLNLRNDTSRSTIEDVLYLRVQRQTVGDVKTSCTKVVFLIAITCCIAAILGVCIVYLCVWRMRSRGDDNGLQATSLTVFSYKELHEATKGFSERLGHGGFGAVFRGSLAGDSSAVAVKRLERPEGGEKEFRAEVRTIGNVQHMNLVRLRGFCCEGSHRLLVYEFMPNGALSTYLRPEGPSLSWEARFRVAVGAARGVAYLHEECRSCIIHCDIKPENILLDEGLAARVSDFGMAKVVGRDFSRVAAATVRGTWGYVAPEWISGAAITAKADVYSYGMTMLELLGGRRNVVDAGEEGAVWFFPPWAARRIVEGDVAAVVDGKLGGDYDTAEAARLGRAAVWCIQDEEGMRPTMGMVVRMLEGVVEVAVPPPPKLLQALVSGDTFRGVVVGSGGDSNTDVLASVGLEASG